MGLRNWPGEFMAGWRSYEPPPRRPAPQWSQGPRKTSTTVYTASPAHRGADLRALAAQMREAGLTGSWLDLLPEIADEFEALEHENRVIRQHARIGAHVSWTDT